MLVGNGHGFLGLKTPKSAVSQGWIAEINWFFFHADINLAKLRVLIEIWFWDMGQKAVGQ